MCIEIGPEFHCLEGENNNSNAYRNKARIAMFGRIRSELQYKKDRARIPMCIKIRLEFSMFGRIRTEFQCS